MTFNLHEGGCPEGCRLILSWHRIFQLSVTSQMYQFRLAQPKMKTGQAYQNSLLVSRQCFLSKTNQIISTKFPSTTSQIHFLKCCFFGCSFPWHLDSWQKKAAISRTLWVFQTWNQFCKGRSFKICSYERLYIFMIFSCLSSFLTLSQWHTHSHTLILPPLHVGEPLVHSPVSPSLSSTGSHTQSSIE